MRPGTLITKDGTGMTLAGHMGSTWSRLTLPAFTVLLLCAIPLAAAGANTAGGALADVGVTINQTSGAKPTRFTFTAKATAEVESVRLAFPPGFNVDAAATNAVILDGLQRLPVDVTQRVEDGAIELRFNPAISSGSNVRIQIVDVVAPAQGGQFTVGVRYIAEGRSGTAETPAFRFDAISPAERLSQWLDRQAWVRGWNTVEFFRIFVQPQQIALAVPLLFRGWLMSIALVGVAFPVAIAGGLGLAFLKMAKLWLLRLVAAAYINMIRGTPLFLQIYIAFVGLPIIGFRAPLFITGVVVLALNSSAYLAEIFRAGIQSIHRGQFEAASSLGMSYPKAMAYVIVPQTVKRVLPTMTSEFILLFKDTALLSAVGLFELMLYSNSLATRSGNLTPFMVAAVYYLLITIPLINWVAALEARLAISEGGQVADAGLPKRRSLFGGIMRMMRPGQTSTATSKGAAGDS